MNKKLVTILMILGLMTLLTACGGSETSTTEESSTSNNEETSSTDETAGETGDVDCFMDVEAGATIVFSGWGDESEQQIYRDSIERFNAVCPAVTVDYQPIPADFQTKLKAAMASGTAPDVFYVDDQLMTAFGSTGQLLALDPYMGEFGTNREDFIPTLLSIFILEDNTYALPKDWNTLGLIYLPEIFAEAGIDEPTTDWTWSDLREASLAIAENTDKGGFCQNADWARFAPWVFSNGGAYANETFDTAQVKSEAVKSAATTIADMYEEGSLVTSDDVGAGWCGEAIGKNLVGMTYEGGWMINYMNNEFPDVTWKATELPTGSAGKANIIFTNGIGVNANTANPKAAAAFTVYLTGKENQQAIAETGFASSTHPDQLDISDDENVLALLQGGLYDLTRVAYWGQNTGKVNDAVSQALERVYLGDQDVDTAFNQANEEIQGFLNE